MISDIAVGSSSLSPDKVLLGNIYQQMFSAYGPQSWWPADTPFEVMVGAVLTQNTAWTNVASAINNLKEAGALTLVGVLSLSEDELAGLIRPAGYFNLKAKRLRNLCDFIVTHNRNSALDSLDTPSLRKSLLGVNGVGDETADDILLYAFERPVFVIDSYTRRIFSRLGAISGDESYLALSGWFRDSLGGDVALFNEYHALIVRHAKVYCSKKPDCLNCILNKNCQKIIY